MKMRDPIFVFIALALSACQTTQTVVVQTVTTQVAGNNSDQFRTITLVRDPVTQPAPDTNPAEPFVPKPGEDIKSKKPNPKDLEAVSQYCETHATKVVNIKLSCSSTDQKKTCAASKMAEATYLSEYKHCLGTFGWKEY